jgi:hypothetical protein
MQATVACKKSTVNTNNWNWHGCHATASSAPDQRFIGHAVAFARHLLTIEETAT